MNNDDYKLRFLDVIATVNELLRYLNSYIQQFSIALLMFYGECGEVTVQCFNFNFVAAIADIWNSEKT